MSLWHNKYGSQLLEMLAYGLKSVEYGGGSIENFDLSGCTGVMEGEHFVKLPPQILYQIRSLDVLHCSLEKRGLDILAGSIPHLHNLTSLDVSYNEGGVRSTVKLVQSLKRHGKLETLRMSEIGRGLDDVTVLADLIQSPGSLRELTVGQSLALDIFRVILNSKQLTANLGVKGGNKSTRTLRVNTLLRELELHIPLDRDQLYAAIGSLEDNHSWNAAYELIHFLFSVFILKG